MQSIITKYLGPTNTRSGRIKAMASGWGDGRAPLSVTVGYDHALNADQNHRAAAEALAVKLKWSGNWVAGGAPGGKGYVFVCVDGADSTFMVPSSQISNATE